MKSPLLLRGLVALLLALSVSPAMACGPYFQMAMTQFAAEAKVIAILDPKDVNPALLTTSGEDNASIWMETPMTFLKGSATDTVLMDQYLQWVMLCAREQVGAKIFLMIIPTTEENRIVVENLVNIEQIIEAAYAPVYEARLRELLTLAEQNDLAGQWRWVIRGITEHDAASPVWQDAYLTVRYTANFRKEEPYWYKPAGLPQAGFPVDQRPVLQQYVISQLGLHRGKVLGLYDAILRFATKVGVKDLARPCVDYLRSALEHYEYNREQGKTAAMVQAALDDAGYFGNFDVFGNWSNDIGLEEQTKEVAFLVAKCTGATPAEIADANRAFLYLIRMEVEYPALFLEYPDLYQPVNEQDILHLSSSVDQIVNSDKETVFTLFGEWSNTRYGEDHTLLLAKTRTAFRAFTQEIAPALDMCNDPYITALTGERNWWGCHQAEVKLETFVLAGAASASGDPALSIAAAPNPIAHSQCTLEWKTASDQPRVRIALVDATGREVWSQAHEQVRYAPVQQAFLSLPANLAAGTYLLKVQYPDQEIDVKVLVE